MVYGPIYDGGKSRTAGTGDLAGYARETGERLLDDLQHAEALSSNWADEELGYALLSCAMDRALARLAATGCWGKDNQLASGELWTVAGHLLDVSWLQHCARFKPRGYAGDFEMFERFWRRECVDHPLGKLFDRLFQGQAAVEAVRGRTEQIGAAIAERCVTVAAERQFHLVSVGCGPALDVRCALQSLLERQRSQLRLTLLDLDEAAVEHARQSLTALVAPQQIHVLRENLFRLADKPRSAALLDGADMLVCSGLFDYLPDEAAQKLLRLFWERLAEGGLLLIGNFAPHNPTRAYMEWIGNWYLIYRTAEELFELGLTAGVPRSCLTLGAERLGIDLFLAATKSGV
ncbi:MAG TPA: class I SAM-dependent methyltransferase [Pirellulales bacterium]|nr:class I SAM-dependent methyltransferase [Pirellulales bacterium]